MILLKSLNNNTALVKEGNDEFIIMGKGVAFNKKQNDILDSSLVEKKYILQKTKQKDFDNLMQRINVDDLELASKIIDKGEKALGYKCNDSILMALSDHLSLVIERAREDLYFGTPLEWDIKLIYPNEYRYALNVVDMINDIKKLNIPKQEASFIALHFINSNANNSDMHETVLTTKIIQNILNIVRRYYKKDFDESNFDVSRFINHIRYFVRRQISGDNLNIDTNIAKVIAEKCPNDYRCAMKISEFLSETYDWKVSTSEELYLTLHLNRINLNE